ncbi:DUF3168 domain-containing protein [uncultured Metabacillus sp.]|uniref:DUF3168 domain-containing protein n=1 Tax=uncultured Metabacillus sp. TaxID=2860135 RepID=UPI00260F71BC|nr:DUF3168 domain-containing protein [uncultured Metabacillus sp.]
MIYKIYEALIADTLIQEKVGSRIKFYEYPATGDVTGPYIIIDPLGPPIPGDYADNEPLTDEYLYQVEVWSKSLSDTGIIAKQIRKVLRKNLGIPQYGTGVDEWDQETAIYRDARRYRGKEYVEDA